MTSTTVKAMIEFIEQRLDEEERWADGATPGIWKLWGMDVYADLTGSSSMDDAIKVASVRSPDPERLRTWNSTLIAAHDPGRVKRQCALFRALIPLCQMDTIDFVDDVWHGESLAMMMADVWRDHYAYQEEWKSL